MLEKNLEQEQVDMQRLEEIEKSLRSGSVPPAREKKLEQEKKKMALGYEIARNRTAQNESLQALRKKFYTQLMAAAEKENPSIEKMLDELNMLRHQLQYVNPEAMSRGQ